MKVLITGADGFIAKNLRLFLKENSNYDIINFSKKNSQSELYDLVAKSDFIFHLAGVNRSKNPEEFNLGNEDMTLKLCEAIKKCKKKIPIVYSSSIKVDEKTPYGLSKLNTENLLSDFGKKYKNQVYIYRLPNVFGKWCKPNYNSVVSTFCHNIIHDIPITINNSEDLINLVYIDDVINDFLKLINNFKKDIDFINYKSINPVYQITVGELAKQISSFKKNRASSLLGCFGKELTRALYSTYISYLSKEEFSYPIKQQIDQRGTFMEMLKTSNCGQFSCFTLLPQMTRGNHYHHSKTEKFLVIQGHALFKFLNLDTLDTYEKTVKSNNPVIIDTIPGWAHSIKNIGDEEMVVMLWANEIYDPLRPDTHKYKI